MSISCPPIHNIVSIRGVTTTSNSEYYPEVEDFDMDFEDFDIDIDSADDVDSYAFDAEDEVDFEDEDAGPLGHTTGLGYPLLSDGGSVEV